jgi:hypothetical protein
MRISSLIIDDFFQDFARTRVQALAADYEDTVNPSNQLTYPTVAPVLDTDSLKQSLAAVFGAVHLKYAIFRLSCKDTPCPERVHADTVMGPGYSLIAYLNSPNQCRGGTRLMRHRRLGLEEADFEHQTIMDRVAADADQPAAWTPVLTCDMRANRAFIYRSSQFHESLPVGGFGNSLENGRLVLAAFFEPSR